ncbi:MAG: glycosyltransferase family 4 protein [Bacteroidota bacterium]
MAYPPVRGVLQRNYNLLRELGRRSEVHVLAFDQPESRPRGVAAQDCTRALKEFCAHVQWLPLPRGARRAARYWLAARGVVCRDAFDIQWLQSHRMRHTLQEQLNRIKFDIVHFDTLGLAQYRSLAKGFPAVLNHHNVESAMERRRAESTRNFLSAAYFRHEAQRLSVAERYWCPQFAVNLVVSPDDERVLRSSVPGIRTAVVPNGVDCEYFTPRVDPDRKTLLFCGGLDWYPNEDAMRFFFDSIWPSLSTQVRDVKMYVVGRNPPRWLLALSSRDPRISVPGFVEDIRPYGARAAAYVCPIRCGGGTRLKVLDALAMGIPFIGTAFSCSGLSVNHGEHVLLADRPEEFITRVREVLDSVALRKALVEAGRSLTEREYSWRVVGESLFKAYGSVRHVGNGS